MDSDFDLDEAVDEGLEEGIYELDIADLGDGASHENPL